LSCGKRIIHKSITVIVDPIAELHSWWNGRAFRPALCRDTLLVSKASTEFIAHFAKFLRPLCDYGAITGAIGRNAVTAFINHFTSIPGRAVPVGTAGCATIVSITDSHTTQTVALSIVLAWLTITVSLGKTDEVIEGIKSFVTRLHLTNGSHSIAATEGCCIGDGSCTRIVAGTTVLLEEILPRLVFEIFIDRNITIVVEIVTQLTIRNGSVADPPLTPRTRSGTGAGPKLIGVIAILRCRQGIIHKAIAVIVDPVTRLFHWDQGIACPPSRIQCALFVPKAHPESIAHFADFLGANRGLITVASPVVRNAELPLASIFAGIAPWTLLIPFAG